MGLVGSSVPCKPVRRAVSDGRVSRKRVRQVGPPEVFPFSANRYCCKPQDLGYGAFLFSCAFMIFSRSLNPGQDPLLVQEREAERVVLLSTWRFCPQETLGSLQPHVTVTPGVWVVPASSRLESRDAA